MPKKNSRLPQFLCVVETEQGLSVKGKRQGPVL